MILVDVRRHCEQRLEGNPGQAISVLSYGKETAGVRAPWLGRTGCSMRHFLGIQKREQHTGPPTRAGLVCPDFPLWQNVKSISQAQIVAQRERVLGVRWLTVKEQTEAQDRDARVKCEQDEGECHDSYVRMLRRIKKGAGIAETDIQPVGPEQKPSARKQPHKYFVLSESSGSIQWK